MRFMTSSGTTFVLLSDAIVDSVATTFDVTSVGGAGPPESTLLLEEDGAMSGGAPKSSKASFTLNLVLFADDMVDVW